MSPPRKRSRDAAGWREIERKMIASPYKHQPLPPPRPKCPHCGESVYSRGGAHPQCSWLAEIETLEAERALGRDDASEGA